MGRFADCHPTYYDLQWAEQGAGMRDCVAGASGHLLQVLHFLHLLHWILPAALCHMPVLPAHYNQGEITSRFSGMKKKIGYFLPKSKLLGVRAVGKAKVGGITCQAIKKGRNDNPEQKTNRLGFIELECN